METQTTTHAESNFKKARDWTLSCFKVRPREGARKIWCFYWDPYRIAVATTVGLALLLITVVLFIFLIGAVGAGGIAAFGLLIGAAYTALLLLIGASGFMLGSNNGGGDIRVGLGTIVIALVIGYATGSTVKGWLESLMAAAVKVFIYMSGPALFTVEFAKTYWLPILTIIVGPVIVITTLAGLIMATVGLVRGIEWIVMRFYGVHLLCPQCNHVSEPAHYSCPHCGLRHVPNLLPGPFGVFAHHCAAAREHRLPTMLMLGRKRLPHTCGKCDAPMTEMVGADKHIAFIGDKESGKTTLLVQATRFLLDYHHGRIPEPEQEMQFRQLEKMLLQGETLPSTQIRMALSEYRAFQVEVPRKAFPYHIHLYDLAGEVFANPNEAAKYPFYRCLDAIVLLIDPTGDEHFCRLHNIPFGSMSPRQNPQDTFFELHHAFESNPHYSKAKPQLFFMFVKTDLKYLIRDETDEQGLLEFVRKYEKLNTLYEDARTHYGKPKLVAASALGRQPNTSDATPFGYEQLIPAIHAISSTIKISLPQ